MPFYIFSLILCALSPVLFHYLSLRIYQLCSYRIGEFLHSLSTKKASYFSLGVALPLVSFTILSSFNANLSVCFFVTLIQTIAVFLFAKLSAKTQLVFTNRLKRFLVVSAILSTTLGAVCLIYPPLLALHAQLSVVAFTLSHLILTPLENRRNARFVKRAQEKLNAINPIRIGITGSYGKTTAKNILNALLSTKFTVCATPENYNTPLGIAKTVNDYMKEGDQIFIAEMGARYVGDISELCEIVHPDYALITAIGTQHLLTFGSLSHLKDAKYELIDALNDENNAFFNGDNEGASELYLRKSKGIITGKGQKYGWKDYSCDETGTHFTYYDETRSVKLTTKLLGKHIPSVISQCVVLAFMLGVSEQSVKNAVFDLKPVAHRLELLYNGNDVIIDDAYNGNESGAKNALDVLSGFNKTRIVVTPGLVELGTRQEIANRELGAYCVGRCDYAIFVGTNAPVLKSGAKEMDEDKIIVVPSLSKASEQLKKIKGDRAILFENDLPDNY